MRCYIPHRSVLERVPRWRIHLYTLFGADDKVVTDWVTITSDPNIIEAPTVNATAAQGIYTLSGVRVSNELKNLPKGIYIVNGKKVVKQ